MDRQEHLSQLIGNIYDAALDPELWIGVLAKCGEFVGGSAAALFSRDTASESGNAAYYFGIEPHYKQLVVEKEVKLDPLAMGHVFAELGEPVALTDIIPNDELFQARAYREWGRPQGLVDILNVALDKSATSAALFCVFRHERNGPVDAEMRRRMRLLVPHLRRAVLIGRVVDLKTAEAATIADTFDSISAGMFLVDAHGRIVHSNASGRSMLALGSILRTAGGKLVASEAEAEQTLHDVFLAAGSGDTAVGIKGIAVPLTARNGDHYVAHALPLTSGVRRRAGASYRAVAALFVHKAAVDTPSPPEVIAKTFGLTPTELRVLLGIVEVGGVPGTAEALGIAETTVKTHLHRVFGKTGTGRQAELVKLVAGFSNPLVGSAESGRGATGVAGDRSRQDRRFC